MKKELLNWDVMDEQAKENLTYRIRQKLDQFGEVPDQDPKHFRDRDASGYQEKFDMWRKTMFMPLHDQLQEQLERKEEREVLKKMEEEEAKSIWHQGKREMFKFDHIDQAKAQQERMAEVYTTEQLETIEFTRKRVIELEKFEKGESSDQKILKRKDRKKKKRAAEKLQKKEKTGWKAW